MTKRELPNCPLWLLDAETENENVEWNSENQSYIVWRGGEWRDGVWRGGVWHGGVWIGGVWHGGVWHGGVWLGGVWLGGVWHDGVWHGGVWRDGVWRDGEWHGGYMGLRTRWDIRIKDSEHVQIGCKEKTMTEWDAWFAGTEEFSTKRGTEDFRMIHAAYRGIRAYGIAMGILKEKE